MRTLAAFFLIAVPASAIAQDLPHFGDAALRSIQFVDENEGWAAGDDGVMWHTIDGGKTWERQPTGHAGLAAMRSFSHSLLRLGGRPGRAARRRLGGNRPDDERRRAQMDGPQLE